MPEKLLETARERLNRKLRESRLRVEALEEEPLPLLVEIGCLEERQRLATATLVALEIDRTGNDGFSYATLKDEITLEFPEESPDTVERGIRHAVRAGEIQDVGGRLFVSAEVRSRLGLRHEN